MSISFFNPVFKYLQRGGGTLECGCMEATAAVCRSRFCHAKVRLRREPQPAGRPVGWTKRGRDATEVVVGTVAKAEHGRQRPAIVTEIFEVKASRCAACTSPGPTCLPRPSARH